MDHEVVKMEKIVETEKRKLKNPMEYRKKKNKGKGKPRNLHAISETMKDIQTHNKEEEK